MTTAPVPRLHERCPTTAVRSSRSFTLSDPDDIYSIATFTETTDVNGRDWVHAYDATTKTWTLTSPEARVTTRTVDALGRTIGMQVGDLEPVTMAYL